jgi:hypothetical protein
VGDQSSCVSVCQSFLNFLLNVERILDIRQGAIVGQTFDQRNGICLDRRFFRCFHHEILSNIQRV